MAEPKKKYKSLLLGMLQEGKPIGNMAACSQLREKIKQVDAVTIADDDYWAIRNALIAEGKITRGRGKGGSIYLVPPETWVAADTNCYNEDKKERELYPDVLEIVKGPWANEKGIAENSVACITANNRTPGKWRNPDISMISVMSYDFIPGKTMELTTFEIKANGCFDVQGIFETASHFVVAHRSYLMIQDRNKLRDSDPNYERLVSLLPRFGVGLVLFEDPGKYDTYETIAEAKYQPPEPAELSDFIKRSFPEDMQRKIRSQTR